MESGSWNSWPVASANLDLVRAICADWERGDLFSAAKWLHPEVELVFADGPSPGTWAGLARAGEGLRDWLSPWEHVRMQVREFRELDDERVLVLLSGSARGKRSGLDLRQMRSTGAALFHIRDGKVTRLVGYFDPENAFADLGLPSQASSPPS
jgi:ketosteroid isomerase-like protein